MNAPVPTLAPEATEGPVSLEAEQALLGALLDDNRLLERVWGFLKPDHFADRLFGAIYQSILTMQREDRRADAITIRQFLPEVQGVSIDSILAHLLAERGIALNAADYGRTIYDLAVRRALLAIGKDVTACAVSPPQGMTAAEQMADAERRLIELQDEWPDPRQSKRGPSVEDVLADIEDRKTTGRHFRGVPCGIHDIDKMLGGFPPGSLVIIGARPSMGKTLLSLSMARSAAQGGVGVAFDSIEMSEEQVWLRLLSDEALTARAFVPYKEAGEGRLTDDKLRALQIAGGRLNRLPLVIIDQGNRLSDIANHIRYARRRLREKGKELSLFFIDYLGLLSPGDRYKGQRVHEVTEISNTLKSLAKREGICIVALHQLNRANEARGDKKPILSDLRDSGSLEQDADVVMFVHRDAYYFERTGNSDIPEPDRIMKLEECRHDLDLIIAKQRQGPIGIKKLWCDPALNAVRDRTQHT